MKEKTNKLEKIFCDFNCNCAKPAGWGACNTFTLIKCGKYNREVDKGGICLDYLK